MSEVATTLVERLRSSRARYMTCLRQAFSLRACSKGVDVVRGALTLPRLVLLLLWCFYLFKQYIKWATRGDHLEEKKKPKTLLVFADATSHGFRAFSAALDWKRPQDTLIVIYALILRSPAAMDMQPLVGGEQRSADEINSELHKEAVTLCQAYKNYCNLLQISNVTVRAIEVDSLNAMDKSLSYVEQYNTDVVFVGSRALSAIERLVAGSFSQEISQRSQCSVMIVKSRDQQA